MITLAQAKQLKFGQVLICNGKRWKVNGQVKTWKRSPDKVKVPVKHGLYAYDYVTENELNIVTLES